MPSSIIIKQGDSEEVLPPSPKKVKTVAAPSTNKTSASGACAVQDSAKTGNQQLRPEKTQKGWKGYVLGEVTSKNIFDLPTTQKRERKQKKVIDL